MTQSLTELLARADGIVLRREEAARDHLQAVAVEDAATAALAAARAALAEAEAGHAASLAARASVEGRQAVCRADFDELTGLIGTHGLKPEAVEKIVESRLELLRSLGLPIVAPPAPEPVKTAPAPSTVVASVVAKTMVEAAQAVPPAGVVSAPLEAPAPVVESAVIQAAAIPAASVPAEVPKPAVAEVRETPPAPEVAPPAVVAAPEVPVEALAEAEPVVDEPVEEQPVEEEPPQLTLPEPTEVVVAKQVPRMPLRVPPKAPATTPVATPSFLTPTAPLVAERPLAAQAPPPVAEQAPLPVSVDEAEAFSWVNEVSAEEDAARLATAEAPGNGLSHDPVEIISDEDDHEQGDDAHGVADGVSGDVLDGLSPTSDGASEAEPLVTAEQDAPVVAAPIAEPARVIPAAPVRNTGLPPGPKRGKSPPKPLLAEAPERQASIPPSVASQDPVHASVVAGLDGDLPPVGHQQPDQSFGEDEAGRPIAASAPAEVAPAPAKPPAAVAPAAIATPAPGAPPMPSFLLNMMAQEQPKSPPAT